LGEPEAIQRVIDVSLKLLDAAAKTVPRNQHPKADGLERAKFVVDPAALPKECRLAIVKQ
jgi:hypothetical protein